MVSEPPAAVSAAAAGVAGADGRRWRWPAGGDGGGDGGGGAGGGTPPAVTAAAERAVARARW